MKTKLLLILYFIVSHTAVSQLYELTRFADNNGLPSRIIRNVTQDAKGFIWVSGNNGLYKFDGQKFKPYYASLKSPEGLKSNKIIVSHEDSNATLWVGTDNGLHYLEDDIITYLPLKPHTNESENYIRGIAEDREQNIWVGTYDGLFKIDQNKEAEKINLYEESGAEQGAIRGINKDHKNRLWLSNGLNVFMIDKETLKRFNIELSEKLLIKNPNIYEVKLLKDNTFLVDSNFGILKGVIKDDDTFIISLFDNQKLSSNEGITVYKSLIASDSSIWIGTYENGFQKYAIDNGSLIEQKVNIRNGPLGMHDQVHSIFEDSQQNIWICNSNGLYKLSEDRNTIYSFPMSRNRGCIDDDFNVAAIASTKNGFIWVASAKGLYRFKEGDFVKAKCPSDFLFYSEEGFDGINNLLVDKQNRLWVSTDNGLKVAELDSKNAPIYFKTLNTKNGFPHNRTFRVLQLDENTFFAANFQGLVKLNLPNGNLNNIKVKSFASNSSDKNSLVNSYTIDLDQDAEGNLWIGTFSGVSKMLSDIGSGSFKNYLKVPEDYHSLSNNSIKIVYSDTLRRDLWIGTQSGLNLYDNENDDFRQFGREDGLPSEYILGIEKDGLGFLWITTTNGVVKAKFDGQFSEMVHYSSKDGLLDNISNRKALEVIGGNKVLIGSAEGMSVYDSRAEDSARSPKKSNLVITALKSAQKKPGGFVDVLYRIVDNQIHLSHFENSIQLNYAALDFTNLRFNQYRHKFSSSEQWVETGTDAELNFYNLNPGSYELLLDAKTSDGMWSDNPITLKINISPPFWESYLAYFLYFLVVAGIIRYFYLSRIRKKVFELEQKSLLEKAVLDERDFLRKENTADFHDVLGSKLTKISLFLTLAERALEENGNPRDWFDKIRGNIKDLSSGFRDLLWVIDPKKDSLADTFLRLKDFGEDLFEHSRSDFRTRGYDNELNSVTLDPQTKKQIVLIFKEAMNNSLKHADARNVNLIFTRTEDCFQLELKDDGKGFGIVSKPMNRGLKNMRERAKKIGAEISFESDENGTSVKLSGIPHMGDV